MLVYLIFDDHEHLGKICNPGKRQQFLINACRISKIFIRHVVLNVFGVAKLRESKFIWVFNYDYIALIHIF